MGVCDQEHMRAHLQIMIGGFNVTRANREEHATPKHIEKFVFCLTGPYLVTSAHNEAGWATPHRAARNCSLLVGELNRTEPHAHSTGVTSALDGR
jgi:hypothetical protein